MIITKLKKKRPKLKNDKRKKEYKQKDLAYLKNRYQSTNIDSSSNIDSDEYFVSNQEITTSVKHQWYYDLCENFDKSSSNLSSNYLVIFKGNAGTFDKYALQDFQSIPKEINVLIFEGTRTYLTIQWKSEDVHTIQELQNNIKRRHS